MECIACCDMDFTDLGMPTNVAEAIRRNVFNIAPDDEQNVMIDFFASPTARETTSLKLNIKGDKCKLDVANPRDGRVKLGKVEKDANGKPSKINVEFTPQGKRSPLKFAFSIKDGVLSMAQSDISPDKVSTYLTDADPIRKKMSPKEKRAKEAVISVDLQDGKKHDVKLTFGKGKPTVQVVDDKDTDVKITKVVNNEKGDTELITIAAKPKSYTKPLYLSFKIYPDNIDIVNIAHDGKQVPLQRKPDGTLKVTLPAEKTSPAEEALTVEKTLPVEEALPAEEALTVEKTSPVEEALPADKTHELVVNFKLSPTDKEPCEVKMAIKEGTLTATSDDKADVKVVSSKFDGEGEPTEIKLELLPKGAGKKPLYFTCKLKDGKMDVKQDQPEKPKSTSSEPAEPTEQELVVKFNLDPAKDPCVVKIGILGSECASIGDKQASAEVVDFKCLPSGEPDSIRLRLNPTDGSDGIFFVLRFVDGQLSVEQEDVPADVSWISICTYLYVYCLCSTLPKFALCIHLITIHIFSTLPKFVLCIHLTTIHIFSTLDYFVLCIRLLKFIFLALFLTFLF